MATEKIDLHNLDKSDWKTYRFDEIAQNISERVDPNNTDLEVYIGLEHIDSESLHIRRHGTPDDVNGTKLKFYKDDIIFGRRRAYQRKAGIATCDGFCSAHALVLRANSDVIDPALFPFFMHSDLFMNRAVDISVGSLSPTINWGTLKHQEFLIPPKEIQNNLAKLLWKINDLISGQNEAFEANKTLKLTTLKKFLLGQHIGGLKQDSPYGDIPLKWQLIPLVELRDTKDKYSFTGGPFGSNLKSEHYTDDGVRVLQLQNIGNGEFLGDYKIYTSTEKADELRSCNIYPGELILAKMSPVGRCAIIPNDEERYLMCSDGIRLKVDSDKYDNKFIYHAINNVHFLRHVESKCSGTTRSRVTLKDLKQISVVIPETKKEQIFLREKFDLIDLASSNFERKIEDSKKLKNSLINKVF